MKVTKPIDHETGNAMGSMGFTEKDFKNAVDKLEEFDEKYRKKSQVIEAIIQNCETPEELFLMANIYGIHQGRENANERVLAKLAPLMVELL